MNDRVKPKEKEPTPSPLLNNPLSKEKKDQFAFTLPDSYESFAKQYESKPKNISKGNSSFQHFVQFCEKKKKKKKKNMKFSRI